MWLVGVASQCLVVGANHSLEVGKSDLEAPVSCVISLRVVTCSKYLANERVSLK